jgi:hypothetical protein
VRLTLSTMTLAAFITPKPSIKVPASRNMPYDQVSSACCR